MSLTSQIRYIRALDSAATDGAGKTGLIFSDFTAAYLVEGGTLTALTTETIATLGTYQAPTNATHIRIKELSSSDPTKGVYEVQFHNTQVAVAGVRLWLFLSAAGAAIQPLELDLITTAALPSATAGASGGIPVIGTGSNNFKSDSSANVTAGTVGDKTGYSLANGSIVTATFGTCDFTSTMKTSLVTVLWDGTISGHTTGGTFGGALNSASSAGDPWATNLPGVYVGGTAGYIVGNAAGTNATALLDLASGCETNYTVREALRVMLSALGGKLGITGPIVTIRDVNDTVDRITATTDAQSQRTAVTLDVS